MKDPQLALTHKGRITKNLELQIKWTGYDKPERNRDNELSMKKLKEVTNNH